MLRPIVPRERGDDRGLGRAAPVVAMLRQAGMSR
jgi:hypothetical protein